MKTQKPYYITTEKISVGYDGKPLIEEVEIALRKGEILTLLGPNGAGKSTRERGGWTEKICGHSPGQNCRKKWQW